MADPKNIMLGIMTPQGPIFLGLTVEEFTSFVEGLNTILDDLKGKTPIPKVFEDALEKEE